MPSIDDYIRLRRLGSAQQELAEMMKAQGSFIESTGNDLVSMAGEKEPEEKDSKGPNKLRVAILKVKGKK